MKIFVALLGVGALLSICEAQQCSEFGDFQPWSQCLFFPLANISKGVADACGTTFQKTKAGTGIPMPEGFKFPDKCGHCSFKVRCRKRDRKEGCYSLDLQKETCNEFGDICTVDKHPRLGCRYNLVLSAVKNCLSRPDVPEWRRDAIRRFADGLPQGNCIEKNGQCKCCCHPYTPNAAGTECEKQPESDSCPQFGPFNTWSKCLWYPIKTIRDDVMTHCELKKDKVDLPDLPIPSNFNIPEKCGFCSFSVRCRQREKEDGCFHVDIQKKACGQATDCPTCGNVCTIDKVNGTCDMGTQVAKAAFGKLDEYASKLPYWRRNGIYNLAHNMPYSKCKAVGDRCKCCCYPYEVSEDGTRCELSPMCSFDPVH